MLDQLQRNKMLYPVVLIIGFASAVLALLAYVMFWKAAFGRASKKKNNMIMQISGCFFILLALIANLIYQILELEALPLLQGFGCWYWLGFVAQLPLLIFRKETPLDLFVLFKDLTRPLLGPFQLLFTVWGIWKLKPWRR